MSSHGIGKEVVEILQALVRCPTVNPPAETLECARFMAARFQENGIGCEIIEGRAGAANVVACMKGARPGKVLVLNGHMDVVAPGADWTVEPFAAEIRDEKMYGRGTCDMKSGLAAMMAAMFDLKRSGAAFSGEVVFMGVADEETGSHSGTQFLLGRGIGKGADFAVCSEPTSLRVELGNRGLRWIDVTVKGRACHAGRPHLGVNAIAVAGRIVSAIQSMRFDRRNDAFEVAEPSISVTEIRGGTKVNIIPDRCAIAVDRRMIPGETGEMVLQEIEKAIAPALAEAPGASVEFAVRPVDWDPYLIPRDAPIAVAIAEAFRKVTGKEAVIGAKSAATDASYLYHQGGLSTVLFGPGNERMSHKADECVEVAALATGARVFRALFDSVLA